MSRCAVLLQCAILLSVITVLLGFTIYSAYEIYYVKPFDHGCSQYNCSYASDPSVPNVTVIDYGTGKCYEWNRFSSVNFSTCYTNTKYRSAPPYCPYFTTCYLDDVYGYYFNILMCSGITMIIVALCGCFIICTVNRHDVFAPLSSRNEYSPIA